MKELLTVEWCENQGFFHIADAEVTFTKNLFDFFNGVQGQWITLGIFESHEEARSFIAKLEDKREFPVTSQPIATIKLKFDRDTETFTESDQQDDK